MGVLRRQGKLKTVWNYNKFDSCEPLSARGYNNLDEYFSLVNSSMLWLDKPGLSEMVARQLYELLPPDRMVRILRTSSFRKARQDSHMRCLSFSVGSFLPYREWFWPRLVQRIKTLVVGPQILYGPRLLLADWADGWFSLAGVGRELSGGGVDEGDLRPDPAEGCGRVYVGTGQGWHGLDDSDASPHERRLHVDQVDRHVNHVALPEGRLRDHPVPA